jgi:hypothetical protein
MTRLTEEQVLASDAADAAGQTFTGLSPDVLFGKNGNGVLAQTVFRTNPRAYRQMRTEYEMQTGVTPRPLDYWHGSKV